ncbi:LytTR family transcriptional regulator DNA-binding domain-containing protein [Rhodobacter lacus]|uniref:LytTR family transcriptional regulator DNA-binding domain-containing protein n=1 Tax=Rhodobacter lacus TaxID=1641972 RepID=A0ABW5A9A8_9RHOB
MSLFTRVLLWPLLVAAGIVVGTAFRVLVRDYFGIRRYRSEVPLLAALSAVALAPFYHGLAVIVDKPLLVVPGMVEIAINIFVVSMVFSTLRHLLGDHFVPVLPEPWQRAGMSASDVDGSALALGTGARGAALPGQDAAVAPEVRLLTRLAPEVRGRLIRLEVKDHYVRVVTSAGSESLLMRLADAIVETEGVAGLQVHRSHWVARQAISGLQRERGKCTLVLQDGSRIPVARSHLPKVQALDLPEIADAL